MQIVPYVEIDGAWTLKDSFVKTLWDKMEAEGTAKRVFCTGMVTDRDRFLAFMKSSKTVVLTQWDNDECVFIGWLNNISQHTAYAHFCCFKSIWGEQSEEALKNALERWFAFKDSEGELMFDVLCGAIPETNKLAIRLAERCGITKLGTIPDYIRDAYTGVKTGMTIVYIRRN